MENSSFNEGLVYNDERVNTKVILESSFSKEIRILLKKGQIMKEHQTPFPIVVHLIEGELTFGIQGINHNLKKGDILSLEGSIPHDLTATTDSVVRLTLSKLDKAERVENVAKNSAK